MHTYAASSALLLVPIPAYCRTCGYAWVGKDAIRAPGLSNCRCFWCNGKLAAIKTQATESVMPISERPVGSFLVQVFLRKGEPMSRVLLDGREVIEPVDETGQVIFKKVAQVAAEMLGDAKRARRSASVTHK